MFKILKVLMVVVFVYLAFLSVASAAASPIKAFGGRITHIEKLNEGEYECDNSGSIVSVRSRFGITPYFIPSNARPATKNEVKADRFILGNHRTESVVIECYKKDKKEEEKTIPDRTYIVPPIVYFGLSNR